MLDAEVYTLLDVPVSDALVDEDANRARSDVVDDACSAVGAFSTHTHPEEWRKVYKVGAMYERIEGKHTLGSICGAYRVGRRRLL